MGPCHYGLSLCHYAFFYTVIAYIFDYAKKKELQMQRGLIDVMVSLEF